MQPLGDLQEFTASLEAAVEFHDLTGCLRCCSSAGYNISLSILEGTSNSPDIWNAVNGLNQQGYEGALGAATSHQTQPGSYGSLQPPHSHLVRFTSRTLDVDSIALFNPRGLNVCLLTVQDYSPHSVMAADMNRGLPPMSTFHRNNTASRNTSENSTGEEMEKIIFTAYFSSGLSALYCNIYQWMFFFFLLQSQEAREMCQEGHRQAIPWAKLWPL